MRSPLAVVCTLGLCAIAGTAFGDDQVVVEMRSANPNIVLNRITGVAVATAVGPGGSATASAVSWELVCTAPCETALPRNAYYFVGGNGVTDSSNFILPKAPHVVLDVDAGGKGAHTAGVLMTIFGATAGIVLGGTFLLLGAVKSSGGDGLILGGGVTLGIGALIAIPGLILWLGNGTSVTTKEGVTLAQRLGGTFSF